MKKLSVWTMAILLLLAGCAPKEPVYNEPDLTPPSLTVTCGETTVEALVFNGYNWEAKNEDGEWFGVDAMCEMIQNLEDSMTVLETTEPTVTLNFAIEPDEIGVCCCSDIIWSDPGAYAPDRDVEVVDGKITLKPGGNIYQVRAKWSAEKREERGVMGSVAYCFYVRSTPSRPPQLSVGVELDEMTSAMNGTFSWNYRKTADTFGGMCADGEGAPWRLKDVLSPIAMPTDSWPFIMMQFDDEPDRISVRAWNLNGQGSAQDWEPVEVRNFELLTALGGDYIYEVTAEWDKNDHFWGTAIYHFRVEKQS